MRSRCSKARCGRPSSPTRTAIRVCGTCRWWSGNFSTASGSPISGAFGWSDIPMDERKEISRRKTRPALHRAAKAKLPQRWDNRLKQYVPTTTGPLGTRRAKAGDPVRWPRATTGNRYGSCCRPFCETPALRRVTTVCTDPLPTIRGESWNCFTVTKLATFDVIVIGGAAPVDVRSDAGRRGRHVGVARTHARVGLNIAISAAAVCNFTNRLRAGEYLSATRGFAHRPPPLTRRISSRWSRHIGRLHEKKRALFCDFSSRQS